MPISRLGIKSRIAAVAGGLMVKNIRLKMPRQVLSIPIKE